MTTMLREATGQHVRGRERRVVQKPAPTWYDPRSLHKALAAPVRSQLEPVKSDHREMEHFEVYVTERGESDIVLQFLSVKVPDFATFLAEAVQIHFGTTEGFSLDQNAELKTFGLLMRRVRANPAFNEAYFVDEFLQLLEAAAGDLVRSKR